MATDPEVQINHNGTSHTQESLSKVSVFPLIHAIRKDVLESIDTALTWGQLTAPDVNFTVVRPLVFKYARLKNMAVVHACLVVRSHFQAAAENDLAFASIIQTRASLCELLALKMLRHFTANHVELAAVLTMSWNPLQGAPAYVVDEVKQEIGSKPEDLDNPMSALEMAISTQSKQFLSSPLVQNVINDIWAGRTLLSSASSHALVRDDYKTREITTYDFRNEPFLDHYRLRVPKYRAILEFMNFALLLFFFVVCLSTRDLARLTIPEGLFMIFAFGFILDEFASSQEHGWTIYAASMWNGFDMAFIVIFLVYIGIRLKGLLSHDPWFSDLAFDILACGACLLFPRLAFFSISNNVIILALQGMIMDFVFFMFFAAICFSGLLFTLHHLAGDKWPVKNIAWLMLQIWFGNTYLSFVQASSFHPLFGPILMVVFAALSNTLLITILISILSNTFARINEHASEEYLFQFAISTLEGVKADAIFSYQPPFNLAAYAALSVLSWFLSPRTLHTVNVFMIRVTSFPVLLAIAVYERYFAPGTSLIESGKDAASAFYNSLPRSIKGMALIDAIAGTGSNDLLDAIFNVDVDDNIGEELFGNAGMLDDDYDDLPRSLHRGRAGPSSERTPLPTTPDIIAPRSRSRQTATDRQRLSTGPDDLFVHTGSLRPPASLASPLARAYGQKRSLDEPTHEDLVIGMRKLEDILGSVKALPLKKMETELKDVRERQERIEALLLTLTRGMRS